MYCCDTDEAENAVQKAMNSETTVWQLSTVSLWLVGKKKSCSVWHG